MGLEGDNDQKENPKPENEQEDVKMKENSQNPNDDVLNVMKRMAQIMSLNDSRNGKRGREEKEIQIMDAERIWPTQGNDREARK